MKSLLKRVYVSFDEMERAFNKVRGELADVGLLSVESPLDKVDCYYECFSRGALYCLRVGAMGFYGFEDMNIHVPSVWPAGLFPWYEERKMPDVIRHEFGHALADRYKKFFRGGIFKKAFGKSYGEYVVFDGEDWTEEYVSGYATTNTQEDFAETFMLFLKYKGKLPARFRGKRAIERKWKTVGQIVKSIIAEVKG